MISPFYQLSEKNPIYPKKGGDWAKKVTHKEPKLGSGENASYVIYANI